MKSKQLAGITPSFDPVNPPAGRKLVLAVVATKMGVTITELAEAAGTSRTSVARILTNEWPVRADVAAMKDRLFALMQERGATPEELQTLFHAYMQRRKANASHGPDHRYTPPAAETQPSPRTSKPKRRTETPEIQMLLPKQTLSSIARRQFKLFVNPFDGEVRNGDQFHVGREVAFCREAIWQCAQTAGFMALVGESGAGKTTLMQEFEARLDRENKPLLLIKPSVLGMEGSDQSGKRMKSADILHAILQAFNPGDSVPPTLQERATKATRQLTNSAQAGNDHLLVLEEAHCLPDATLKHLKRMHEMRVGRKPLLGVLLLAQPELKRRLADGLRDGTLREVAQRCEILELLPLDDELGEYLERRASAAGATLANLFTPEAVAQIRARLTVERDGAQVSMCYPLAVNNLATRALNLAAELGADQVTAEIVTAA